MVLIKVCARARPDDDGGLLIISPAVGHLPSLPFHIIVVLVVDYALQVRYSRSLAVIASLTQPRALVRPPTAVHL